MAWSKTVKVKGDLVQLTFSKRNEILDFCDEPSSSPQMGDMNETYWGNKTMNSGKEEDLLLDYEAFQKFQR